MGESAACKGGMGLWCFPLKSLDILPSQMLVAGGSRGGAGIDRWPGLPAAPGEAQDLSRHQFPRVPSKPGLEVKDRGGHSDGAGVWVEDRATCDRKGAKFAPRQSKSTPSWSHPNQECSKSLHIPPQVALPPNPAFVLLLCPSTAVLAAQLLQGPKPWLPPVSLPGHYHLPNRLLTAIYQTVSTWQPRLILLNAYFEIISNSEKSWK